MDKKIYKQYLDDIRQLINKHDPIALMNMDCPEDEYDPETESIAPKLKKCTTKDEVHEMVHLEFVEWFDESAGEKETYLLLAEDLWVLKKCYFDT